MTCVVCGEKIEAYHNTADCPSGTHHLKCPCPDYPPHKAEEDSPPETDDAA